MLHIGKRIKEVFVSKPKTHTVEWFARELCCNRANIYDIFHRSSIDTQLLQRISIILQHDFFAELSEDIRNTIKRV